MKKVGVRTRKFMAAEIAEWKKIDYLRELKQESIIQYLDKLREEGKI